MWVREVHLVPIYRAPIRDNTSYTPFLPVLVLSLSQVGRPEPLLLAPVPLQAQVNPNMASDTSIVVVLPDPAAEVNGPLSVFVFQAFPTMVESN